MDRERADRVTAAHLETFEQALQGAYEDPWWRLFIETVKERRASFIDSLVAGDMDQRSEDRTRGQISELNFILALDQHGGNVNGQNERRRADAD